VLERKKNMARKEKVETVRFDGAEKCYVCEAIDSEGLKFVVGPAVPVAICERCQRLTAVDLVREKDKQKQKRLALVLAVPGISLLLKSVLPKVFGVGRRRRNGVDCRRRRSDESATT
jgi:hypothetical protein